MMKSSKFSQERVTHLWIAHEVFFPFMRLRHSSAAKWFDMGSWLIKSHERYDKSVMRVWHSSTARWFDMSSKLTNVMMRECDSFMKRADDFFVVMRLWRSSAARSFDVSACDLTWVRVSWWSRKGYEFVIQHEARTSKKIEMMQLWHSSAARWFNVSSWLMIKSQTLR